MSTLVQFLVGWAFLIFAGVVLFRWIVRPYDSVDRAFRTAPRESVEPVVDLDRIDKIFADMTCELPELRRDLSAYYLTGKEDQHG